MKYESVIGLEIHAQLLTMSKLFCGCSTRFGGSPNSQTCPICLGFPGVLPVLNYQAVEYVIKTALALCSNIHTFSRFARKNYFYPDLPKAYQISQYELPFSDGGYLEVDTEEGSKKRIGLIRIHLEEDAGKLVHGGISTEFNDDFDSSFVDFNRTGVPLLEIVTEPQINTPEEARKFLQNLKTILQYLKVCDGNMEEGSLRCDANVSVKLIGQTKLGVKTEIKNMNSFRNVQRAIEYEIKRQIINIEKGKQITQQTRLWDADKGITYPMRSKEEAHDYRYFPDPDLLPLYINTEWRDKVAETLPELPENKKGRFIKQYNLPLYDAEVLTSSAELAGYFEECWGFIDNPNISPKIVSNWIMVELLKELNRGNLDIISSPLKAKDLAGLLKMLEEGKISGKIAKNVFAKMYETGKTAEQIINEENLIQITDRSAIDKVIEKVLNENPGPVLDYKRGKKQALGFLVGQVMRISKGKANPKIVNQLLIERLGS